MMRPLKFLAVFPAAIAVAIAIFTPDSAQALTFYSAKDPYDVINPGDGFSPGSRFSSDAAASSFDGNAAALGPLNLITFDDLALTDVQSIPIGPGVTATWFNQASFTIFNNPSVLLGYNTTPGGSQFARVAFNEFDRRVGVTFSFATPIQAWGAYFTGVGTASGTTKIEFSDGTMQTQTVLGDLEGGISFLGFTDPGRQISSVTVLQEPTSIVDGTPPAAGDIFGIDDMRYVPAVPAPFLLPGIVGLAIAVLKEKLRIKD